MEVILFYPTTAQPYVLGYCESLFLQIILKKKNLNKVMEIKSTLLCQLQRHLRSHRADCWGLAEQTGKILSQFPDLTHFFTITSQYT